MKRYSRLYLLLAAGMFAACNNDDGVPAVGHHFTFDGGVGTETAARASWNDDKGTGNLIFRWDYTPEGSVGDEMVMAFIGDGLLASEAGTYHTYANINKHSQHAEDTHWAMFETVETYNVSSGECDGHQVLAVTPLCTANGSSVSSTADAFTATMPMPGTFTQVADQNPEFLRNYMYAESTITGGSASLSFKHIPATFRFIITNKRPNEANIKSIQMSLTDATLPVASQSATVNHEAELTFSGDSYTITTLLGENGTAVQTGDKYTAYALALPLADNNAFKDK
ncbi:MAG: hypothetical protein IJ456_10450 [Bacteroides sp.]|nr:hypothetical protein [Bacteroides sp.]